MEGRIEQLTTLLTNYAPRVVGAILTLIIGFWIIGWVTNMVKKAMKKQDLDETIRPFLGSLA
ncbi:MAG: small conductance mechanosensitive channel [Polaribacter sp.]|jgi:small conductance mechanosensitive channel